MEPTGAESRNLTTEEDMVVLNVVTIEAGGMPRGAEVRMERAGVFNTAEANPEAKAEHREAGATTIARTTNELFKYGNDIT